MRITWWYLERLDPRFMNPSSGRQGKETAARDGNHMLGRLYLVCVLSSQRNGAHTDVPAEQTGIAGRVSEEFNCLPVENEEFRRISEKRALEALRPKRETVFVEKLPGQILQARHALPGDKGAFVVCNPLSLFHVGWRLTYL